MNSGLDGANVAVATPRQPPRSPSQLSSSPMDHSSYHASTGSSVAQRNPATQYETPPSRPHSPITTKPLESEMTLPTRSVAAHPQSLNTRQSELQPAPGSIAAQYRDIYDPTPPSPGVDERPFLRFAIEQLTRDEEVMGWAPRDSDPSFDYSADRSPSQEGLIKPRAPTTVTDASSLAPEEPVVVRRPPSIPRKKEVAPRKDDLFIPVETPSASHPPLGYLPLALRLPALLLLIVLCFLLIAALLFCNIYSLRHSGLSDYDGTGTSRYFVFQFLPQILGIFVIIWISVLQAAVYRIIPFASMSSSQRRSDRALQDMSIQPANFLVPDLRHFKWGEPLVGVFLVIFWLSYFSVPLLSSMFQTELFYIDGEQRWRWTSVQGVVWFLFALYILLVGAVFLIVLRFHKSQSALLWDPASIADLIVLFQHSNIINAFDRSELARATLPSTPYRLGYWTTTQQSKTFHTIGFPDVPTQSRSRERLGKALDEKRMSAFNTSTFNVDYQRYSNAESFTRNIHSPFFRYRWTPWFLRDSAIVAWIVASLILYLAFLVVSFVNRAVERGFLPRLPTTTNTQGFSPSNFLFSFLPSLLGMILFLAWQPIDVYFRALQPFANLSASEGATAQNSLLLTYPSTFPLFTPILALINKDLKLAWISLISLTSTTLPVLGGGIFTAQFFDQTETRIAASMPAYTALCVFLGLYAFSFLVVWPTRKRYLPHKLESIADYITFIYQSPLLRGTSAGAAGVGGASKEEILSRFRDGHERFAFGIYVGRDGREHLGIDRLNGSVSASGTSSGNETGSGNETNNESRDYVNALTR